MRRLREEGKVLELPLPLSAHKLLSTFLIWLLKFTLHTTSHEHCLIYQIYITSQVKLYIHKLLLLLNKF